MCINTHLHTGIKPLMHEKIKSNKRLKKTILGKANVFTFFFIQKRKNAEGCIEFVWIVCLMNGTGSPGPWPGGIWTLCCPGVSVRTPCPHVWGTRPHPRRHAARQRNTRLQPPACGPSDPASCRWEEDLHTGQRHLLYYSLDVLYKKVLQTCVKPQVSLKVLYVSFWLF